MNQPVYTPYSQTLKPFSIGLSALDPQRWIEPDGDLEAFLAQKDRLCEARFDEVYREDLASRMAQQECLDMLAGHLTESHAAIFKRMGGHIRFGERSVDLADPDRAPLQIAGSLVADDLVILEKREGQWRLTAGYVAFPSGWSITQKEGLAMAGVHAAVPGFEGGSRNAMMLDRIFDNLQPDLPAMRFNWSIYPSGDMFWPPERSARAEQEPFTPAGNFIRVERQTLRRLPKSGAIVFTIRIYADPIAKMKRVDGDGAMALALADKLMEFSAEQLAYKGMLGKRDLLVDYLRAK
jgi:hypothetical protein